MKVIPKKQPTQYPCSGDIIVTGDGNYLVAYDTNKPEYKLVDLDDGGSMFHESLISPGAILDYITGDLDEEILTIIRYDKVVITEEE